MEKEKIIQCVPMEMVVRLKQLHERLWEEKNPAAIHLSAVMDEFEAEMRSLEGIVQEYEVDYSRRFEFMEKQYKDKIRSLEEELAGVKTGFSSFDDDRNESSRKVYDLEEALKRKDSEVADLQTRVAETEADLNARYVARMEELYNKINKKETDMIARWEEKNKALEERGSAAENEYAARERQLKTREKELEDDYNSKKTEMIRTFERMRLDAESRERAIENEYVAKERQIKAREKSLESDFNSRKTELIKTFDKIRLDFEAREAKLAAAEKTPLGKEAQL